MKKMIVLYLVSTLLFSCFKEEAAPGFLDGTVWVRFSSGPVLDEENNPLYSCMENDTLLFERDTYTYIYSRKKTESIKDASYKDSIYDQTTGTYTVKYPEIIMSEENQRRIGTLSVNVLTVDWNKDNRLMYFVKKKTD
ncbi:MAG: hypothetical protein LBS05_04275 [Tannerellaceae bacterium]|jgi:hypothetical protein|nr:hypothetical protein [Tannerellaceae bacterium]